MPKKKKKKVEGDKNDGHQPCKKNSHVVMVGMVVRFGIDGCLPLAKALERIVCVMADVETILHDTPCPPSVVKENTQDTNKTIEYTRIINEKLKKEHRSPENQRDIYQFTQKGGSGEKGYLYP